MGKVKGTNGKAAKGSDPLSAVKKAGVTKAADSTKVKSKQLAKDVATKASAVNGKSKDKKKKKVESESESEASSDDSESESDDSLYEAFKDCEGLSNARVVTDKAMQRSRGFGYVDFESHEAAKAAFEKKQGLELEGRALNLDPSKPRPAGGDDNSRANDRAKKFGDSVSPESDTLFVGNLSFDVDEDTVAAFFGDECEVKSIRLPKDPESGNPKGFGYVTFNSIEDAKTVYNSKNGGYIGEGRNARACRLDFAGQRPPRGGGRGSGRGGFGGGRGGKPFEGKKITF